MKIYCGAHEKKREEKKATWTLYVAPFFNSK